MKRLTLIALTLVAAVHLASCRKENPAPPVASVEPQVASDLDARLAKLPKTPIDYDRTLLDENEKAVVAKLVEAARHIHAIFLLQVDPNNPTLIADLEAKAKTSPEHAKALELVHVMAGKWDRLAEQEPFVAPFDAKPAGAGFYPSDLTSEELEAWIKANPADEEAFRGLFTVIRREGDKLVAVPYSQAYREHLEPAAAKLREAAGLTTNASLKSYLEKRADAFLSDDYYESDIAWMDLDSNLEVVIGPYEVYEDELFNYKAAFEAYICVVDKAESEKLTVYKNHLLGMEKNLPMPDEHKNMNRGSESPIRVVQEIYTAGDGRRGVQTAAFNLPNDERVREAKGSKKVLLKNVMQAKYDSTGKPAAERVLDPSQTGFLSFDAFFNQVLFHELTHGIGPGIITGPDGKKVEARILLKDLYSTIEECKADTVGVWSIYYAMDKGLVDSFTLDQLHATYAALLYRSMRFGIDAAHGGGAAIQWNWLREKEAIVPAEGGRFKVDMAKMKPAIESLSNELLMIEATGDYARAKALVDKYRVATDEIQKTISTLSDIPTDITPVFVGAGE